MEVHLIKSEQDYERALLGLASIFDATPGTLEGDECDVLTQIGH
jgi:antitoxin component HigA of HigAB toxin-antitoxin module